MILKRLRQLSSPRPPISPRVTDRIVILLNLPLFRLHALLSQVEQLKRQVAELRVLTLPRCNSYLSDSIHVVDAHGHRAFVTLLGSLLSAILQPPRETSPLVRASFDSTVAARL